MTAATGDSVQGLYRRIMKTIESSSVKVTSGSLERMLWGQMGVNRREFRSALRALVENGELTYTNIFGTTYVETSYNRPVRIGRHIILTPPECRSPHEGPDIDVVLKPGASFGVGQHPTTRLAVEGIEYAIERLSREKNISEDILLDIGTGSGVLALAALKMGIRQATGTDIDPCAIAEAMENAALNGVSERFLVINQPAESIEQRFHIIAANLRYPTLIRLSAYISGHVHSGGMVILSGIRDDEAKKLKARYEKLSLNCCWEKTTHEWCGMALTK